MLRSNKMSMWQQESSSYSPCIEIDSSSIRTKDRLGCTSWLKQEQDDLRIIKWENFQTGASTDAVQDNTPSSAMSGSTHWVFSYKTLVTRYLNLNILTWWNLFPTALNFEGLPPRVLLTITKLQCMLESKQERIATLEKQVEDLMQDRKFLRSQIDNLTSNRSMPAFATPCSTTEGQWLNWSCL